MKKEIKIAKEVAVKEVKEFVEYFMDEEFEDSFIEDAYPYVVKAVMYGLLTFDDEKNPKYILREPLKSESGNLNVTEIEFLTRITVSQKKALLKGLDPFKDSFELLMKSFATIIRQPVAMLDKLNRFDFKALEQIATVFL